MRDYLLLSREWTDDLACLIGAARSHLTIASPYVTTEGITFLLENLAPKAKAFPGINLLTDLSPANVCDGATDPNALGYLVSQVPGVMLRHLPRLHAKVYIADVNVAIVTSANLTTGGLARNYEYGVKIRDALIVADISRDISAYSELGALVTPEDLRGYCEIAKRVRGLFRKQRDSVCSSIRSEFQRELADAELQLIRLRLSQGPMHTVFAKTILYILSRCGPLSTEQLHPRIQSIHPDLCDDSVDRIIDGKHFGKKWKHAVRSAQQQLRRKNMLVLEDHCWRLK